jgi:RHS repeat-associated protein
MQPAQILVLSESLLAAMPQLREKLHQGVPSSNPALHQGQSVCNSTTALGLRAALHLERIKSRYTGKERDTESGNDYFEARYYSSAMGRFMSPDWSAKEEPVPYAKLDDPQTLNLYSYVQNNPLTREDADGHDPGELVQEAQQSGLMPLVVAAAVVTVLADV